MKLVQVSVGRIVATLVIIAIVVVALITVSVLAHGQQDSQLKLVNCTQISSPGCGSLNEMIVAQDKEVTDVVQSGTAIACFRDFEDKFFIVSFSAPSSKEQFLPSKGGLVEMYGMAAFREFERGTSKNSLLSAGTWRKLPADEVENAWFESNKNSRLGALIHSAEIELSYAFSNVGGTATTDVITIRRSTLRFSETLEAPQVEATAARKGGTAKPQPPKVHQLTFSGHCAKLN